jgi:hypothetical protein
LLVVCPSTPGKATNPAENNQQPKRKAKSV